MHSVTDRRWLVATVLFVALVSATGALARESRLQGADTHRVEDFIWVGTRVPVGSDPGPGGARGGRGKQGQRQFTEEEFRFLADNYDLVVLAVFHCGGNRSCHNDAARRLKELNPDLRVLAYHNVLIREYEQGGQLEVYGADTFDDAWFLEDANDQRVLVRDNRGAWVDTTEAGYRDWVIDQVTGWMEAAPFDGVAFDRSYTLPHIRNWIERLGAEKVDAMNEALVELIADTKAALGREKIVIYNGLKEKDSARQGWLGTLPLEAADGATNEYFCYHKDFGFDPRVNLRNDIINDVRAHQRIARQGKLALAHVSYRDPRMPEEERRHINRFCYGSFLLGHVPGFTSYKFGFMTTERVMHENAPQKQLPLGEPLADMERVTPQLFRRDFDNGVVLVNFGEGAATFRSQQDLVLTAGAEPTQRVAAGEQIEVPARDAVYLLRPGVALPVIAPSPPSSDSNADGS